MSSRKRQVILSPLALQDLENILAYTFRNWGEEQERVYDRAITRAFSTLRRFPHIGRVRDDVSPNHRGYQVKQYVIFYVVDEATVTVDRILHSATDPEGQIGATPRAGS